MSERRERWYWLGGPDEPEVPTEQSDLARELWFKSIDMGREDDFWRLPLHEQKYWIDLAEEELNEKAKSQNETARG